MRRPRPDLRAAAAARACDAVDQSPAADLVAGHVSLLNLERRCADEDETHGHCGALDYNLRLRT